MASSDDVSTTHHTPVNACLSEAETLAHDQPQPSCSSGLLSSTAALLSCALNVTDEGNYQLIGNSSEKLLATMWSMVSKNHTATTTTTTSSDQQVPPSFSCSIPSLQLKQDSNRKPKSSSTPSSSKPMLEHAAANNLRKPVILTGPDQVSKAPLTMLWNLQDSFFYLIQSRLKSTVQALARQQQRSHSSGNNMVMLVNCQPPSESTNPRSKIVLDVLHPAASPIQLGTIVTSFQVVDSQPDGSHEHHGDGNCDSQPRPFLMDLVVDFKVLGGGQIVTVRLQAPGTIQTLWDNHDHHMILHVMIDTNTLLRNLMQETRRLVRRAVSLATELAACLTQTLPRNAPQDLIEQQLLQRERLRMAMAATTASCGGVPTAALLSHSQQQDEQEQQQQQQQTDVGKVELSRDKNNRGSVEHQNKTSSPLHLPEPLDSTTALEECLNDGNDDNDISRTSMTMMPPPPARLPRTPLCTDRPTLQKPQPEQQQLMGKKRGLLDQGVISAHNKSARRADD